MGLFDQVNTSSNVAAEKDSVKGQKREPLASDIYNLIIKHAYVTKAKSGAMAVNLLLMTQDEREIKATEYITSGDAKGNKTYYEKETNGKKEQFNLPGFSLIDSLAQIVTGKSILQANSEKRSIKLYDFDAKAEKVTEVDMLVDLVGKPVCGAVLHQIQDKTAKNAASGEYEATGKTYATNVVDKFLSPDERKTIIEIKSSIPADFSEKWLAKWKDQIDDQSTEVKGAGLKGAPVASGEAAPKTSLFG